MNVKLIEKSLEPGVEMTCQDICNIAKSVDDTFRETYAIMSTYKNTRKF